MRPVPRSRFRRWAAEFASGCGWLFGLASLLLGLAVLTAVPLGQFLALGYLLEAGGRAARTGRVRDGFVGVRTAGRLGGVALGLGLCWLPVWAVSSLAASAQVIDPDGPIAWKWSGWLTALAVGMSLHAAAACLRGGRLRDFARPLNVLWLLRRAVRANLFRDARDGLWHTVVTLRLPGLFWLGVRGFFGAFAWLIVPSALLGMGHKMPGVGILGGLLLAAVVLYLPFLQARFARDRRLRAFLEIRAVRADFRRAPVAFLLAMAAQLLLAVPLYVLKIEAIPRDLVFLEGAVFVALAAPARLLTGLAVARGNRARSPRHWSVRWLCRLLMLAVAAGYVFVVFTSQHVSWNGVPSLFEQHAFLLPVPFTNLDE
ncbi:MAG: hypothetical protein ACRC7O_07905 [Fimbriiglobus sp.]